MKNKKGNVTSIPQTNLNDFFSDNQGLDVSDYSPKATEKQLISSGAVEKLAGELTDHLRRHRKIVKCTRCAGCGTPYAPSKMSVLYPICKNCITAARIKGIQAQSNFINRTLNNFHIFLKGALSI